MNATSLYVSTSRLVLLANADDENSWSDLYRLVPYLRQSLSCTVCSNLLIEPQTPTETNCQHHVCRGCLGGRKKLKPSCGWCKDYDKYVENVQLRLLLQCYKKLCDYLTSTNIYRNLMTTVSSTASTSTAAPNGAESLLDLIQEGTGFKDEFKSNAGLSKSAYSILPCVYTSSTSTQTQPSTSQPPSDPPAQSVPVEPPAIKTVSNGSSIYSVMYAGTGNKITIKRKNAAVENAEASQPEVDSTPKTSNVSSEKCTPTPQVSQETTSPKKTAKGGKPAANFKKPRSTSTRTKKKGCRCGNATAIPGKLTCCGQRCPCYVESKPCIECRCRGCRNPHTADGLKIRPHIPELHNLQLQLTSPLDCDSLGTETLSTAQQCLSTSPTTIQVLNVYSTPQVDIDNVSQDLPATLFVGGDTMVSTGNEADDNDVQIDV